MTRDDLVNAVAPEVGLTKAKVNQVFGSFLTNIMIGVRKDGRVSLKNFGTFRTKINQARKARNPTTNEVVDVPKMNRVRFKPGKYLRESIQQ